MKLYKAKYKDVIIEFGPLGEIHSMQYLTGKHVPDWKYENLVCNQEFNEWLEGELNAATLDNTYESI